MSRTARIERQTKESKVLVEVNLDGTGRTDVSTGVGFYDHMLDAFGRHAPLDEALVQAVVDVSGRPYCVHTGEPEGQQYVVLGGDYLGSLTRHVFETIAFHAHIALHVRVLAGREPHHIVETQFKAFARAFRDAVAIDPRETGVPSTKGSL